MLGFHVVALGVFIQDALDSFDRANGALERANNFDRLVIRPWDLLLGNVNFAVGLLANGNNCAALGAQNDRGCVFRDDEHENAAVGSFVLVILADILDHAFSRSDPGVLVDGVDDDEAISDFIRPFSSIHQNISPRFLLVAGQTTATGSDDPSGGFGGDQTAQRRHKRAGRCRVS